jgi:hypothetical protein
MPSKSLDFRRDQDLQGLIRRWWGGLVHHRGDRSDLARATSIDKVYQCDAFYRLKRALEDLGYKVYDPALARTAAVLSLIRRDRDGERFGVLLSKEMRFEDVKRVLKIQQPDRLLNEFRHFVDRVSAECPVLGVADLVYWWEVRHPNREFLYDFFLTEQKEGA